MTQNVQTAADLAKRRARVKAEDTGADVATATANVPVNKAAALAEKARIKAEKDQAKATVRAEKLAAAEAAKAEKVAAKEAKLANAKAAKDAKAAEAKAAAKNAKIEARVKAKTEKAEAVAKAKADKAAVRAAAKADRDAAKAAKAPGGTRGPTAKIKAMEDDARLGNIPTAPDFSPVSHKPFRKRLGEVEALVTAGDIDGLKAYPIEPTSSSRAMIHRYRNLAVLALEARAAGTIA